ncbi:nucleoside diphosphate kinase regulator [Oxalobacter vibrioformis]|uniref:Nucleoside diphosphate kinase regulator n=1 Tax=Oxalobacter vibrioformis TaxID=933080 RepID=A0A9E9LZC1_9BURK|nr:nucleoside diphosphate kinase regulator [Oxalobacter vibrioformis]NLC24877.1 nucleoside diphosphate kinase regulator [Oxalobacter sp.]WAW10299.1 nucleoside diphosphate kinase regulator [Oxalobacter vibrioformis]
MLDRPSITVTADDFDYLEQLLDLPKYRNIPARKDLLEELRRASIVEPGEIGADIVTLNSTIRFVDDKSGEQYEMTLVSPEEADSDKNRISVLAPVGIALLGLSVGQTIQWQMPGRQEALLRVLEVTRHA